MKKIQFVILLLLAFGCLLIQAKKEEKTAGNAVAKANTNLLEYIQLFKSLLNQALSKGTAFYSLPIAYKLHQK